MDEHYFIGIDVGTGSARAALCSSNGDVLSESTYATKLWRDDTNPDIFEQSTQQIWECISKACKDVVASSGIKPSSIKGIGFDATCSLAVISSTASAPVSVTPGSWLTPRSPASSEHVRDIILWADHRAQSEAALINDTHSSVLDYVGGTVSVEMQIPKVLWLKNHMPPSVFADCIFFDLPDWLTFKATGDQSRSICSLGCKFTYVPEGEAIGERGTEGWNKDFLEGIGLGQFVGNNFLQLSSSRILTAGSCVGGLSAESTHDLGLVEGTAVASSVIDAYAGWIGTIAAPIEEGCAASLDESKHRLAAIAGTSTCHIVQSRSPVFVNGVWGPYRDAVFSGYSLSEAGQSSTGQLLDHVIASHPSSHKLQALASSKGINHFALLEELLKSLALERGVEINELTKDIHVYPDFHGNRSPLADPLMRGLHSGISLDTSITDLALLYLATLQAISLQTKHIVDTLNATALVPSISSLPSPTAASTPHHEIRHLFLSGGLVKNALLMQLLADVCNMPVVLPHSHSSSVVLGAAMLGAAAFADHQRSAKDAASVDGLWEIMVRMSRKGTTVLPTATKRVQSLLQVKYEIFRECIDLQRKWRGMTDNAIR